MTSQKLLWVIALLFMFMPTQGCAGENDKAATMSGIPSSARSRKAIQTQRPRLEAEFKAKGLELGAPVFLRIFKESMELELFVELNASFHHFKTYSICTYGGQGLGPKLRQGDGRAPEGFYFVPPEKLNPNSRFHLSFNLGYPNAYDRYLGRTGSALMVHGSCVSIGCYAMTDPSIEEIYTIVDAALRGGQPYFRVHIFPFRMTTERVEHYRENEWIDFWKNLREGYDWFEERRRPPNVNVRDGRYIFSES